MDSFLTELSKKEKKLCKLYKDTCLMLSISDSRSVKQATDEFNKAHYSKIDYKWCAVFRYINLEPAVVSASRLYKQIIIL